MNQRAFVIVLNLLLLGASDSAIGQHPPPVLPVGIKRRKPKRRSRPPDPSLAFKNWLKSEKNQLNSAKAIELAPVMPLYFNVVGPRNEVPQQVFRVKLAGADLQASEAGKLLEAIEVMKPELAARRLVEGPALRLDCRVFPKDELELELRLRSESGWSFQDGDRFRLRLKSPQADAPVGGQDGGVPARLTDMAVQQPERRAVKPVLPPPAKSQPGAFPLASSELRRCRAYLPGVWSRLGAVVLGKFGPKQDGAADDKLVPPGWEAATRAELGAAWKLLQSARGRIEAAAAHSVPPKVPPATRSNLELVRGLLVSDQRILWWETWARFEQHFAQFLWFNSYFSNPTRPVREPAIERLTVAVAELQREVDAGDRWSRALPDDRRRPILDQLQIQLQGYCATRETEARETEEPKEYLLTVQIPVKRLVPE